MQPIHGLRWITRWTLTGLVLLFAGAAHAAPQPVDWPAGAAVTAPEQGYFQRGGVRLVPASGPAVVLDAAHPQIDKLAVGRTATTLGFVHNLQPGPAIELYRRQVALAKRKFELPPPAPVVLSYVVHYADDQTLTIPVRWDEAIADWYRTNDVPALKWATVAWTHEPNKVRGEKAVAYEMLWPNPRPDVAIASIDIITGNTPVYDYGTPLVLGIWTDDAPPPGHVYYLQPAPVGNDANPGTWDQPWATPAKAAATLQAGDTVYIRGGFYPITAKIEPQHDGRADAWITYSAFPGEVPIIDGFGNYLNPQEQPPIRRRGPYDHDNGEFHLVNRAYIRVKGLQIQQSRRCGMYVSGGHDIDLLYNTIFHTYNSAIYAGYGVEDLKILGNLACQPCCKTMDSNTPDGHMQMVVHPAHEGISVAISTRFEVAYNEVYASDKEGIDCKGANHFGKVHHNYVHDVMAIGLYYDSYAPQMDNMEIYANTVTDSSGIVVTSESNRPNDKFSIHHNIVYNCAGTGIAVSGAKTTNVDVYNNTVYNCGWDYVKMGWSGGGILLGSEGTWDANVRNNIAVGNAQWQLATERANLAEMRQVFEHNLSWPMIAGHVDHPRDTRQPLPGAHAVTADPLFVDAAAGDFRLRAGSPAIDAGSTAHAVADPDGTAPDLGALPFGTVTTPGLTLAGKVLTSYGGPPRYEPVTIPRPLLNARMTHRGRHSGWFGWSGMWDYDLRQLPTGEQLFAGTTFFIPDYQATAAGTYIMLKGQGSYTDQPAARGIPVGRAAKTLAFLHTYNPGRGLDGYLESLRQARDAHAPPPAGPVVLRYVVHYADGTQAEVPIRYGSAIDTWKRSDQLAPPNAAIGWIQETEQWRSTARRPPLPAGKSFRDLTDAERTAYRAAWEKERAAHPPMLIKGGLVAYVYHWQNPHPDQPIATLDVLSANTPEADYGAPAVFAISVEK